MTQPKAMRAERKAHVDGKTFTLLFDMNALAEFEESVGIPALGFLQAMEREEISIVKLRHLTRAMLLPHHPDATLADAGAVMSHDMAAVMGVMEDAMPEPEGSDNDTEEPSGNAKAPPRKR